MKTQLSILTLIASAVAGTAFADVSAYRQSSGTHTNSGTTTYVGNDVWGADSESFGNKFYKPMATEYGALFQWDSSKNAFLVWKEREANAYPDENGEWLTLVYTEYWSFDTLFALSGTAVFENTGTANFSYYGEKTEEDYKEYREGNTYYEEYVSNQILVAFSDNSKFVNKGTLTFQTNSSTWAPQFEVYFTDNAQLINDGLIQNQSGNIYFYDNAKFYNNENGVICNDTSICIYENSYFENAGKVEDGEISVSDYGQIVNKKTGSISGDCIDFFCNSTSKTKFVNYGSVALNSIDYDFFDVPASSKVEAVFENYGTLSARYSGGYIDFEVWFESYQESPFSNFEKAQKSLIIKNYGTIDTHVFKVCSYVDLTLAEGSAITGKLSLGNAFTYYDYTGIPDDDDDDWGDIDTEKKAQKEKSVLNIVFTGKAPDTALVQDGIELNNQTVLKFEFAEGFTPKTYTLNLWDGAMTGDGWFDTSYVYGNYEIFLSQEDGTMTIKDSSVGEEHSITTENAGEKHQLGKNDVAVFEKDLPEFSGSISGGGQVDAMYDITFSGNAQNHSGKTVVGGTFTVTENAQVSQGTYAIGDNAKVVVDGGKQKFGAVEGAGTLEVRAGNVSFEKEISIRKLTISENAELSGNVNLNNGSASLELAGELELNTDKGEKVSLSGNATLVLKKTATLDLGGAPDIDGGIQLMNENTATLTLLKSGKRITLVEGGNIDDSEKPLEEFLQNEDNIADLASRYAVVMYTNKGLSLQVIRNASALSDNLEISDDLREAAEIVLSEVEMDFAPGLKTLSELTGVGGSDPLAEALLSNPKEAGEMIVNILPVHYAAMVAMTSEAFHTDVRSIANRLEQRRYDGYAPEKKYEFFFQAQGMSVDNDNSMDSPTFDFDTVGFLAGVDNKIAPDTIVGFSFGADFGDADIHNGGGEIEMSDVRVTGFLGKTIANQFYVNTGVQVGSGSFDIKRKTVWGDPRGDATSWNAGGFVEAGTLLTLANNVFATPYVGLAYVHTHVESFEEEGLGALWSLDSIKGDSLRARVGCGFSWNFTVAEKAWRLGLDVAYSHDFMGEDVDIKVKGDFPTMTADAMPTDMFSVSPVLNIALTNQASVYAGYTFGTGTDSATQHNANVGFRLLF